MSGMVLMSRVPTDLTLRIMEMIMYHIILKILDIRTLMYGFIHIPTGGLNSPYFINHDYKACYVYDDGSDSFEVGWDSYGNNFMETKTPSTC